MRWLGEVGVKKINFLLRFKNRLARIIVDDGARGMRSLVDDDYMRIRHEQNEIIVKLYVLYRKINETLAVLLKL